LFSTWFTLLAFTLVLAVQMRRKKTHSLVPFLKIACLVFMGYATVWNLNYLFAYVSLNPGSMIRSCSR